VVANILEMHLPYPHICSSEMLVTTYKTTQHHNPGDHNSVSVLNEETVIAQSLLFLLAGFETSSTLLTFACYELALNQDIQQNLRKEIKEVLGKYGGYCSYEALLEMNYLEMVLLGRFVQCTVFIMKT
jgi:cytochrome P450